LKFSYFQRDLCQKGMNEIFALSITNLRIRQPEEQIFSLDKETFHNIFKLYHYLGSQKESLEISR